MMEHLTDALQSSFVSIMTSNKKIDYIVFFNSASKDTLV